MSKVPSGKVGVIVVEKTSDWLQFNREQLNGAYVFALGALYRRDRGYITTEDEVCIKLMGYEIRNYVYNFS